MWLGAVMFVHITDNRPRPKTLGELGLTSASNPIVSLSEFTYGKGAEIFGENEPAEYVYQVRRGAVRSYKLLSDGRRQIGAFHSGGRHFLKTVRSIDLPQRPSSKPLRA
jgi:CRP/FNR family transcriptional regulator, nitrogen fixation regulation protein